MLLNKFSRFKQILFWLLLPCIFIFEVVPAYAYTAFDIYRARSGYVLARGLVLENDLPVWAQYNENGKIVGAEYPYASNLGSYALSAHTVNTSLEVLSQLKSEYGDRLVIMSREQYESATLKTGLKNKVDKFSLTESIKSVVFLEPKTLVSAKQHIILLRARFDLNSVGPTNGNTRSLLLNRSGQLIAQSEYNFAFKSAFYEGDGENPSTLLDLKNKKAYAPFKEAFVEVMAPYGGMAVAGEDGRWLSTYGLVPCPLFFFEYNTPAYMNYFYANFNPKAKMAGFDYQVLPGYDACIGYDAISVSNIVDAMFKAYLVGLQASISKPSIHQYNFFVDTNILGGQAEIYDPFQNKTVPIGSETKYTYREPEIKANEKPMFYFDGDDLAEYILYGNINNEGEFVCKESVDDSKYYGVYLSSNEVKPSANCDDDKAEIQQPDLMRVVDIVTDLQPQGLLESLSEDDLRDTDMFIFRESTGMLLTQRKGRDMRDYLGFFDTYDVINNKFSYQFHMRGPQVLSNYVFREYRGEEGFNLYQSQSHMNPELHRREADHLKPNEMLRIILINRKTGYIGSKLRSFSDIARQNASVQELYDFADITEMHPPNLKITAERIFEPNKNSIKTGQQKNVISYEGSALSSDSMLVLTTEWFDNDGTPLPAGLADFGYTGRLAKVAGNNSLVTVGGELANFAIKPGRNIVQINLPGGASTNEHFYVNVSGEPISESPSFEEIGAGDGPLAHRPKYYVPFKVPVFNEELTTDLNFKYKKAVEAGEAGDLAKPEPVYRYVYRPEYQFSTYELKVNDILRQTAGDNVISLYPKERPLIGSSDDMVTMMYDLLASNSDALEFLGEGQELVFSLGADEIKATIGESGQVRFERLDHIAALDVEDFVTLSLYNNTDPTNVLWDYAFEAVLLDTRWVGKDNFSEDGSILVSADDPVVPLQSLIIGYANRENKLPINLKWGKKGHGAFKNENLDYVDRGVFETDIELPPVTGKYAMPYVYIEGDEENYVTMNTIKVIPGEPASIEVVSNEGEVFIEGHKGKEISLIVRDKNGNVVADDTPISFKLDGPAKLIAIDDNHGKTVNGRASVFIKGQSKPSNEAKITFSVHDVSTAVDFVVHPLVVKITDYPTQMEERKTYPIEVTVTEPSGTKVSNVPVVLNSNVGRFARNRVMTNSAGKVSVNLFSGFHPIDDIQITARVGLVLGDLATTKIKPKATNYLDTSKSLLVIDKSASGTYEYERYDGANIGIKYDTSSKVIVHGKENSQQIIRIGTTPEPNIQSVASFTMNYLAGDTIADDNQLHNGIASFIQVVDDNPILGGKSFAFNAKAQLNPNGDWLSSKITIPQASSFKMPNSTGFRLDIKPKAYGGMIFDLEGGAQSLELNTKGELVFSVHNDSGKVSVKSHSVVLNQWSTISGKYKDGLLLLVVNGQEHTVSTEGTLKYSVTKRGLTIGEKFTGNLSRFKLYDYDAEPLVTFSDGTTEKTIQFNDTEKTKEISLISTGQFNTANRQANALRVGIQAGETTYFISAISAEYFGQLAAMYSETGEIPGYPPIDLTFYKDYPSVPLIGVANAGLLDWVFENAFDILREAVGVMLPIDDGIMLVKQIYYLSAGKEEFDPLELTLSGIGVISAIPVLKPVLLPLKNTLGRFLRPINKTNPRFIKSIGGVIGKIVDELLSGRLDTALSLGPFIIIVGQLAFDDDARAGLLVMVKSITSSEDILAWIDYVSAIIETKDEEPTVSMSTPNNVGNLFLGYVYANNGKKIKNPTKAVNDMRKVLGFVEKFPVKYQNKLSESASTMAKAMVNSNTPAIKKLSKSQIGFASAMRIGQKGFDQLVKNAKNLRLPTPLVLALVAYAETRRDVTWCEKLKEQGCVPFSNAVRDKIVSQVYNRIFITGALKDQYAQPRHSGALFQLATLVARHLEYETAISDAYVRDIESRKIITIYGNKGAEVKELAQKIREVDLVLSPSGPQGSEPEDIWFELKSLTGQTRASQKQNWKNSDYSKLAWKTHNLSKGTSDRDADDEDKSPTSYHKQFFFDRVGTNKFKKNGTEGNVMKWRLQQFKRPTIRSYTKEQMDYARKELTKLPLSNDGSHYSSLGYSFAKGNNSFKMGDRFELWNFRTWMKEKAGDKVKENIFPDLDTKTINEMLNMND